VTRIGSEAFRWCIALTDLTIPDSVTSIGNHAFRACTLLKTVTIGGGVTSIGEWAFSQCASLTALTIPASVTSIGEYAFCNCARLKTLHFQGAAPTRSGSSIFLDSDLVVVHYLPGAAGWESTFAGRPAEQSAPR
jgi:hypothetical protein